MKKAFTIVIKLGTSSIVDEVTHQPLISILSSVAETVLKLRQDGHKLVIVSSGAIGVGLKRMAMKGKPKSLAGHQALAAIGQGRLIALWDDLFGHVGQPIAQILLTRGDISERTRYLNAVNTFTELLAMGVVPIVNENDTVSVREIKFGDNDTLSAITASMLHADYLFLLTDVDALYTTNPRKDPTAKSIDVVSSVSSIRAQVNTATLGSKLGTGGMETKLIAAEIATGAGTATIITSSKDPTSILRIIEYNASDPGIQSSLPRPPHTIFLPVSPPLRDLKSWTFHTLAPAGTVIIDAGAHIVLSRRDSGGRLLPAGVIDVHGTFASGQAVKIAIRQPKGDTVAAGISSENEETKTDDDYSTTYPPSPRLLPILSLSSSIASLEPLTRANSLDDVNAFGRTPDVNDVKTPVETENDDSTWEIIEVGRGLANYNWAEIKKVKGVKSSYISNLLGYADSEYVVENITIRILP